MLFVFFLNDSGPHFDEDYLIYLEINLFILTLRIGEILNMNLVIPIQNHPRQTQLKELWMCWIILLHDQY